MFKLLSALHGILSLRHGSGFFGFIRSLSVRLRRKLRGRFVHRPDNKLAGRVIVSRGGRGLLLNGFFRSRLGI